MTEQKNKISLNDKIINFVSNNIVWIFLGFIGIVIILPRIFIGSSKIGYLDNLKPNEIGDAIGGMTAPIIGLFSAFLVYIAFREQKKANEELQVFNKKQIEISEFQNLKLMLDYLNDIANRIIIKKNSNEIEAKGLDKSIEKIKKLIENINNLTSYDIINNIEIKQFKELRDAINKFENKIIHSEIDELDKEFLKDSIKKYKYNETNTKYDDYIKQIESKGGILLENKDKIIKRSEHLYEIIELLK